MRRDAEHGDQAVLLVRVHQLVDRDLTLDDLAAELSLNLISHVDDGLSCDAVEDAAVVRWSDQLKVSISASLEHEDVEDGHLLDIVIQEPKDIIESVHFSVGDTGHQWTQVARDAVLTVTQGPVLVDVVGALEADRLVLQHDWVEHDEHLGRLRCSNAQSLICREVNHSSVELVFMTNLWHLEPLFVESGKFLDALVKLIAVEQRHVQVLTRVVESLQMLLRTEGLEFISLGILNDADSLMDRDAIVEGGGRSLHLDGAVGEDLWRLPAAILCPIDAEHMICEKAPKYQLFCANGLDLANINHLSGQVCRSKGIIRCSLGLHGGEGPHEHRWLRSLLAQSGPRISKSCRRFEHIKK